MMKKAMLSFVLISILAPVSNVLCQASKKGNVSSLYPNELKGFELMKNSKLKTLIPGVSTKKDVDRVFGEDCKNAHKRLNVCELDKDWYVNFLYDGETDSGILWNIEFYPHKRIPFSKIRFPKSFSKDELGIVHLPIEVDKFISYRDKFGMSYVIIDGKDDWEFKKGDLFYINYGMPEKGK